MQARAKVDRSTGALKPLVADGDVDPSAPGNVTLETVATASTVYIGCMNQGAIGIGAGTRSRVRLPQSRRTERLAK
jgi:hypothetical protein